MTGQWNLNLVHFGGMSKAFLILIFAELRNSWCYAVNKSLPLYFINLFCLHAFLSSLPVTGLIIPVFSSANGRGGRTITLQHQLLNIKNMEYLLHVVNRFQI